MKTVSIILLQIFLLFGCNDNSIESNDELFGLYEASTFIEPGANDGGVNIIASGGYMKINFKNDFSFSAEIFIPEGILSNYSSGTTNYSGSYSIENNILKFNTSFIVDELIWEKGNKIFISKDVPLRGQPFEIILYKNIK